MSSGFPKGSNLVCCPVPRRDHLFVYVKIEKFKMCIITLNLLLAAILNLYSALNFLLDLH